MNKYVVYPKEMRKTIIPIEKNRCFFLMPFSKEFDLIYGTIKKKLNDENFVCNRADEIAGSTPILSKILNEICKSQYLIVDLTNSNPNVYYELGIAHTLKEARNVLLIKQKNYKAPFDISHLTYIEYDPNNLLLLVSTIINFLDSAKQSNTFYEALNLHNIISFIDENNNETIEFIQTEATPIIPLLTDILLGEIKSLDTQATKELVSSFDLLIHKAILIQNQKLLSELLDIIYETLIELTGCKEIRDYIGNLLNNYFDIFNISNDSIMQYKTKLALKLARDEKCLDIALPWIIDYFSRSKSTTIDLNRYQIEHFLMTTKSPIINEAIINSLLNPDCYIREHMSDIIGEKKLVQATNLLFTQLPKETNFFTAQSMIEAIGKLKQEGGIEIINEWIERNELEIISTNQLFVLKHAFFAISVLDNTKNQTYITTFKKKYGAKLKNYYIV